MHRKAPDFLMGRAGRRERGCDSWRETVSWLLLRPAAAVVRDIMATEAILIASGVTLKRLGDQN
jgi:hypothetical protein